MIKGEVPSLRDRQEAIEEGNWSSEAFDVQAEAWSNLDLWWADNCSWD